MCLNKQYFVFEMSHEEMVCLYDNVHICIRYYTMMSRLGHAVLAIIQSWNSGIWWAQWLL